MAILNVLKKLDDLPNNKGQRILHLYLNDF